MLGRYILLFTLVFCSSALAYELTIIQGISRSGQTFITRNGKKDGILAGKIATFTADNVSIIAKAIQVTREFTQWEIENNFTDVPFRKGQVVTYYDTQEYLWALTPEKVKSKYVKSQLYAPRKSISANSSFYRGITESVSGIEDRSVNRGGVQFEGYFEKELNRNMAGGIGLRYTYETINVAEATLVSSRFIGIVEGRYYFNPMRSFYGAKISFSLGLGFGQSSTDTDGLVSSGSALLLPITKIGLHLPISRVTDFTIESAFESLETVEELQDGTNQVTNVNNFKVGIGIKRYFK